MVNIKLTPEQFKELWIKGECETKYGKILIVNPSPEGYSPISALYEYLALLTKVQSKIHLIT